MNESVINEKRENQSYFKDHREIPSRVDSWRMFDRIAPRYDLLNRLLSFRQDVRWRKKLIKYLPAGENQQILDLATGTADVLLTICNKTNHIDSGYGIDPAQNMLWLGRNKVEKSQLARSIQLLPGDAQAVPFRDNIFDSVTIAFGIRNVISVEQSLIQMYRVLKPAGRVLILEFSLPESRVFRWVYFFYFRRILPKIGKWISGDNEAYRYLNETVETFPYGEAFCELMRKTGFKNVEAIPLTFGIASIYSGDKE